MNHCVLDPYATEGSARGATKGSACGKVPMVNGGVRCALWRETVGAAYLIIIHINPDWTSQY